MRAKGRRTAPYDLVAVANALTGGPDVVIQDDDGNNQLDRKYHGEQGNRDQPGPEPRHPAYHIGDEQDHRRKQPLELKFHGGRYYCAALAAILPQ